MQFSGYENLLWGGLQSARGFSLATLALLIPVLAYAGTAPEAQVGPRTTPPTISTISPMGAAQGATTTFKVDGSNLMSASAAYFSQPGIKARIVKIEQLPAPPDNRLGSAGLKSTIDLGPMPQRNVVTLEVDVASNVELGPLSLRLQTPLGLTTPAKFVIEPNFPQAMDKEPDNDLAHAVEADVPSVLVGAISKPGDVDFYKFNANAGDRIVFDNGGMSAGSNLRPAISILDSDGKLAEEFSPTNERGLYAHEFKASGTYYLRIADFEEGGTGRRFYRIVMGKLPVVLSAFPLGIERGHHTELALTGWNLASATITAKDQALLRPEGSLNWIPIALGDEPEVTDSAQSVTAPVTINGRLTTDHRDFHFRARKGENLIIETDAARLGSPLDSVLEILDAGGKPVERATIRAVEENSLTLNDRDSVQSGMRLLNVSGFKVGDYMMVGSEIVRVAITPHGPDEDTFFESFNGQRISYFDTSGEGHASDSPIYKIQILPPGSNPPPNGLPLVHLMYRNDDGGPGYGKDSLLHFTAPRDGDYIVRLSDVRGRKGAELTYRLSIRPPRPDYSLALKMPVANVPAGGRVPVTVVATRIEGYNQPIHLSIEGLPAGLHATDATIPPGEFSGTLVLSADPDAKLDGAVPLVVKDDHGREASPRDRLRLIALTTPSDIAMISKTREIRLKPGSKAEITVDIERHGGYAGRVPVEVRDLPDEIVVANVGLNGVLINETENTRTFTIQALENAKPVSQTIVVSGRIETRPAGQENTLSGVPIHLVGTEFIRLHSCAFVCIRGQMFCPERLACRFRLLISA